MAKTRSTEANLLNWNISELVMQNKKGKIDFSVPIQRGYVWDNKRNSLLIHSILIGIPINEFYFNKVGGKYEGLEGKQRNRAIIDFVGGYYKLHANTPMIELDDGTEASIAHYSFEKLPEELQSRIMSYSLRIYWFDNADINDKILIFTRINSGKPVTAADLARVMVLSRKEFVSLAEHSAIVTAVREKSKLKNIDEDIVEDIWILANVENPSLLNKYRSTVLKNTEATPEQLEEMTKAFDYMSAFYKKIADDKKLFSKVRAKTHITMLGYMSVYAIRNNIPEDVFVEKTVAFFSTEGTKTTNSDEYNTASLSGSAKADQVKIRMSCVENALNN